jgi:hypothetical protein
VIGSFGGMRIICDPNALKDTIDRTFPVSRHRSARTHKKLIKRFGGEFRKGPAIFQINGCLIVHPSLYQQLERRYLPIPGRM